MKPFKMRMITAVLLLQPLLLVATDVNADGALPDTGNPGNLVCYGGIGATCSVASSVDCSYIPQNDDPGHIQASGRYITMVTPSEPSQCVGGVATGAPPFVPPTEVVTAATVTTYYHNDVLGSPVSATDDAGEVVWKEEYRPYGARTLKEDEETNDLWYTGKPHEEAFGLSYYGARWYDPDTGRFTGMDPASVNPENLYTFNRYMYANNNPYRYLDPDGRMTLLATEMMKDSKKGTKQMHYRINFTEGGFCTSSIQTVGEKTVKLLKRGARAIGFADSIVTAVIGRDWGAVGDNQFSMVDSVLAKSYDPEIREAFKKEYHFDPDGVVAFSNATGSQRDIRKILDGIWKYMPEEAKEIYKRNELGSVEAIIKAANERAIKDPSVVVYESNHKGK